MSPGPKSPPVAPRPAAVAAPGAAPAAPSFADTVRNVLGLDLRSLALFRIAVAVVVLWDLNERAWNLRAFHTDEGYYPVAMIPDGVPISVHVISGALAYQAALHAAHVAVTVGLLLGWRTSLMALLSWFFQLSVQARNPTILHGGDGMLRMMLFWSLFVPLGEYWSLDARRRGPQRPPPLYLSAGTAAFFGQIVIVYWCAAIWKGSLVPHIRPQSTAWHTDGTALNVGLHIDPLITSFGVWLRQYHGVTRFLTHASLWLEAAGPALLLLPFHFGPVRTAVVLAFVGFHFGIDLCMAIGIFPWVCIAAWLAVLPPWFWDRLLPRLGVRLRRWAAAAAPPRPGAVVNAVVAFVFAYCVLWNVRDFDPPGETGLGGRAFPHQMNQLGGALGLRQGWGMFAPTPSSFAGWFVFRGVLDDGTDVDLLTGGPVSWERPALIADQYVNARWRRFRMNLYEDPPSFSQRPHYADFLAREYMRDRPGRRVRYVEVHFFRSETAAAEYAKGPRRELLFRHKVGFGLDPAIAEEVVHHEAGVAPELAALEELLHREAVGGGEGRP